MLIGERFGYEGIIGLYYKRRLLLNLKPVLRVLIAKTKTDGFTFPSGRSVAVPSLVTVN